MKDSEFTIAAATVIDKIFETVEDSDKEGQFDIDLNDSILTLINENGTYVINKQKVLKEIWLSSPVSGPHHFAFQDSKWKARNGVELFELLTKELGIKIG
ncbi:MAG: iron donor protein CyaY [Rickettsiaceae bacterium]